MTTELDYWIQKLEEHIVMDSLYTLIFWRLVAQ